MQHDCCGERHADGEPRGREGQPRRALGELLDFLQQFMREGRSHGEWVTQNADGGLAMPWVRYSEDVPTFIGMVAAVRAQVPGEPNVAPEALLSGAAALSEANLAAILALVAHADRAERFCDGALLGFLEDRLSRVAVRLREIHEAMGREQ